MYSNTKAEQLLEMARQEGVLRARDARKKDFTLSFFDACALMARSFALDADSICRPNLT